MTEHQEIALDWMSGEQEQPPSAELRPEVPHPARMYDYYLGGKDNFPADRAAAEQVLAISPLVRISAQANRAFLQRAVRTLAEQGVRQFLDIGTGIPSAGNTHEIAQAVAPSARVVYLDNDPIVLVHGRALLAGARQGSVNVLQADLRKPEAILADPAVRDLIDLDRPVALQLFAILHFIDDADDPYAIVRTLVDALPSGSYLALSHATGDFAAPEDAAKGPAVYRSATAQLSMRTRAQVLRFFDGLDLLEPGLVTAPLWRPDQDPRDTDQQVAIWAGVARKP
ncbi:S-adenosyl methyltransferase [Kitasatospora sp. SolWspMP-SS2h]|uniref:SAM-dependent methyltransferase n=1 Tax=Kitasatospora sp. SolWspMP-SS2h TaxID=1305729 RepID=UPI000DBA9F1C|nr:SAM-dependent methyltransferase [Kitasatospora sp. SolWspMP-SS2h]RAJ43742.1 S-adenosyl methyltransferase [Kitasatospora sp. SolWspMP-SS2h]